MVHSMKGRNRPRGPIPGLIAIDVNLPVGTHPELRRLMAEFGWVDAAEWQAALDGSVPANTYSQSGDFDATTNVTRIDAILMNKWARAMFHKFWVTTEVGYQHRQLHLQ